MSEKPEVKAGYLVLRLKIGEGALVGENIEVRLANISTDKKNEAQIAIKAPKEVPIKRLK